MRHKILGLTVFVAAFLLGEFASSVWLGLVAKAEPLDPAAISEISVDPIELPFLHNDAPPAFDLSVNYARDGQVKLLLPGEFHADEVPYRSGEKWMGLFRVGDSYRLMETTLRKTTLSKEELYDFSISTSNPNEAVFLVRGAKNLLLGEIRTVFDRHLDEEFGYLSLAKPKTFGLRGSFWRLRIDEMRQSDGSFSDTTLILSKLGFSEQTLVHVPNGCDDCGWSVEWIGDLDMDGQLDFLIDLSTHYNSSRPTLFMSGDAGDDRLVEVVAGLHRVGC